MSILRHHQLLMSARGSQGGGDPYWDDVVALLHFDGVEGSTTFTDDTGTLWAGQGAAKITTAVLGPFGGACAMFNGNGRILSEVAEKLALGTEDFTLEFFVRRTTVGVIFDNRFGSYGSPMPISVPNSRTDIAFRDGLPGVLRTSSLLISDWYHYALVRDGGTVRQYLSGTQQDGEYTSLDSYTNTQVCIGAAYPGPSVAAFFGYIAEFRITKRVARYTENFDPPTEPFPNFGT